MIALPFKLCDLKKSSLNRLHCLAGLFNKKMAPSKHIFVCLNPSISHIKIRYIYIYISIFSV